MSEPILKNIGLTFDIYGQATTSCELSFNVRNQVFKRVTLTFKVQTPSVKTGLLTFAVESNLTPVLKKANTTFNVKSRKTKSGYLIFDVFSKEQLLSKGKYVIFTDDDETDFERGIAEGTRVDMRPGLVRLRCFGACLGPINKGDRYLGARVWMVTKEGDKVIVRQANETNDAWALEEEAEGMSLEEQAAADLPDIYFDKQGQYVIAYEKAGVAGPEVWVSRVTTDPGTGQRLVVQEKVADGREPKLIRDLDNDMVVFYRDVTDPQNTLIKYRIQSEGWATEREVPIPLTGEKWVEDVVATTKYQLMLLFTLRNAEGYQPYVVFTEARIQAAFGGVSTEFGSPAIEITSVNWIPNQQIEMTDMFTSPEVGIWGLTLTEMWDGSVTDTFRCDVSITGLTLTAIRAQTEAPLILTCSVTSITLFSNISYPRSETSLTPEITIQGITLIPV